MKLDLSVKCSHHQSEVSQDENGVVFIHCHNCHFTAWMHPQTYRDLLTEPVRS